MCERLKEGEDSVLRVYVCLPSVGGVYRVCILLYRVSKTHAYYYTSHLRRWTSWPLLYRVAASSGRAGV